MCTSKKMITLLLLGITILLAAYGAEAAVLDDFHITWNPDHVDILDDGNEIQISLDSVGGSGFGSNNNYLFGSFSAKIKLVPGNSAGTVTSYYLSSSSSTHDEIDFEFLGNVSGEPYILQTNIFSNGIGGREQRIYAWFDPSTDFHKYSVTWNHGLIGLFVDDTPIRVFKNVESITGVVFPATQPMALYSSMFDASSWATRGGREKIDYAYAPFVSSYTDLSISGCEANSGDTSACTANYSSNWWEQSAYLSLNSTQESQLRSVRQAYLIYDYCTDYKRYNPPPPECDYNNPT